MDVTAICERSGDWWAIAVPEVEGGFTQAKRLDQVPAMVADLVNLATGTPADQVHVTIDARVPGTTAAQVLAYAEQLDELGRNLQKDAAAYRRHAMRHYQQAGLPVRDIGHLVGVSYQRVSQILNEPTSGDDLLRAPLGALASATEWPPEIVDGLDGLLSAANTRAAKDTAVAPADDRPHVYTVAENSAGDPTERLDGAEAHAPHPA